MLKKNNFVVTLKTEKEILDYFKSHTPGEERLLWLGFFIAHNHIAHRLEQIDESKWSKKNNRRPEQAVEDAWPSV